MSARSSFNFPNPLTTQAYNFSSSGNNAVVSAVANKSIRVYRMKLKVGGACNVTIKDGSGNVLDGPLPFVAGNEGWVLDFPGYDSPPWYETAVGSSFIINIDQAVACGGSVEFVRS